MENYLVVEFYSIEVDPNPFDTFLCSFFADSEVDL